MLPNHLSICRCILSIFFFIALRISSILGIQATNPAVELTYANLTSNLEDWDTDLAVMFYAPWCKYCKQLAPSFDQIATVHAKSKDLIVGKFNCEVPPKHAEVCKLLGVDRYPSVYFIGYGNFHFGHDGSIFQLPFTSSSSSSSHPSFPRIVRFVADMFPEAILDWITMLTTLSQMQRTWSDFASIFTGNSRFALFISYNLLL